MSVVSLNVTIKSNENILSFKTKGILNEKSNILIYDDNEKIKNVLDLERNILKRENSEFILYLYFDIKKETLAKYSLNKLNSSVNMNLKTLSLEKNNNKYTVIYIINDVDKFEYILEIKK